jgi:hypothetical protein
VTDHPNIDGRKREKIMYRTYLLLLCLAPWTMAIDFFPGLRRLRQKTVLEIQSQGTTEQQQMEDVVASNMVSKLWEVDGVVVSSPDQNNRRTTGNHNEFFAQELIRNLEYDMSLSLSLSL